MSQQTAQAHKQLVHTTTTEAATPTTSSTFTPKFSASLVARFPALEQSKRDDESTPRQTESQHKLLKRVAKPLAPQSKRSKQREALVSLPHANKYLRRPVKHTFSGRVHDLNVARIIKTSSQRNGSLLQSAALMESGRSKSLEAQNEDRLQDFASKQHEFREYMKQLDRGSDEPILEASDHSRSVSPASVADSLPSVSSRESTPGLEMK